MPPQNCTSVRKNPSQRGLTVSQTQALWALQTCEGCAWNKLIIPGTALGCPTDLPWEWSSTWPGLRPACVVAYSKGMQLYAWYCLASCTCTHAYMNWIRSCQSCKRVEETSSFAGTWAYHSHNACHDTHQMTSLCVKENLCVSAFASKLTAFCATFRSTMWEAVLTELASC